MKKKDLIRWVLEWYRNKSEFYQSAVNLFCNIYVKYLT